MYYQDLQPYTYMGHSPDPTLLTVGWLDCEHRFEKGNVPSGVLDKVLALCFKPVNQTRGFHLSPFLSPAPFGYPVELKGQKLLLGAAEIRILGANGSSYAAPNLIYHYIKDCKYTPPTEVVLALQAYN